MLNINVPPDNTWTFEGALYSESLGYDVPLRSNYSQHHRIIESGQDLTASLRAGDYVFPGGYELAYVTNDGQLLCGQCVRDELYQVIYSIRHGINDGWKVIGSDVLYEGGNICDHCSKNLDAYGETS